MRRWLVWGAWTSGIVIGAPVAALALVYLLSDTWLGQRTIERAIGLFSGGEVRITGLGGEFPGHPHIAHLEVSDEKGVWLTLDNLALDWAPLRLFDNRADIAAASADRLSILRMPVTETTSTQSTFRSDIARLAIARADIAAALAGHPMTVSLTGRVHYVSSKDASWNVAIARVGAPGTLVSDGDINRGAIVANAVLREPGDSVAAGLAGLPNLGPLSVDLHLNGPRWRELLALTAHAGALDMQAHGAVDLVHKTALVDVAAHSGAMEPRPGFAWKAVEFRGHVQGRFVEPTVMGHLSIAELRAAGGSVTSLTGDVEGRGGRLAMNARANVLKLPGSQPMLFAAAPIDFGLRARLDAPKPHFEFALAHPLVQLHGDLTLGVAPLAHVVLTLPDIDPLSRLAGVSLGGAARLTAIGSMVNDVRHVSVDASLQARGASFLARLLGRAHSVFSATSSDAGLFLDNFALNGQAITIGAKGSETAELRNFSYEAKLANLASLSGNLAGELALHGTVLGKPDNFAFTLGANGSAATRGYAPEPIEASLRANGLPRQPQGQIDISGRLDRSPLRVAGRFDGNAHAPLKVDVSTADWRSVRLKTNLLFSPAYRLLSGKSWVSVGELGDLGALIGMAMKGSVQAAVNLTSGRTGQSALVHATGSNIQIAGAQLSRMNADGAVRDPLGKPVLGLRAAAAGAFQRYAGAVNIGLGGPLGAVATTAQVKLKDPEGNPGQVSGKAVVDVPGERAQLSALDLKYRGDAFRLAAPARLTFANGVSVDRLQLASGRTGVLIQGRLSPTLALQANIRNATPDLVRPFVPGLNSEGSFSVAAKLTGRPDAPEGTVLFTGTGLKLRGSSSIPATSIDARANIHGKSMQVAGRVSASNVVAVNVSGEAPLTASGRFNLRAKGAVDLASFDPLLAPGGKRARGRATIDGGFSGTLAAPNVIGTVVLANGDFQDYLDGIHLGAVNCRLEAHGGAIFVRQLSGTAGHGSISGSGSIALWRPGIPVDVALVMTNARPLTTDRLSADLNANLKLTGHLRDRMTLSGKVTVGAGEVNIAQSFPPSVAVLNIRHRGQPAPRPATPDRSGTLALDLVIVEPGGLYVRGHGIDADVAGRIAMKGTTGSPEVSGGFELRRGEVDLAGKTLNIDSGKITFDGRSVNGSFDPALDFAASNTSGSLTAKLTITGHASAPHIELTSTPSAPQDEVLAHLLFGENVSQLSALELAEVAGALASLGGSGGGFNPLTAARRSMGLDKLAVGGTDTGNGASVEMGKNISRGIYVGAKQDTTGGTQAQVQVDLTKHLKLQTTVSAGMAALPANTVPTAQNDRGSSVGLSYQFEY